MKFFYYKFFLTKRALLRITYFFWTAPYAVADENRTETYLIDSPSDSYQEPESKNAFHQQLSLQELSLMLGIAQKYRLNNQLPEALCIYDAILTLMPNDEGAKKEKIQTLILFARDAAQHGKNQEAVTYFQKAIDIDPSKRKELLRELADQLAYLGRAHEAIPLYQEVLASPPDFDS